MNEKYLRACQWKNYMRRLTQDEVYTMRSGPARGLKRRGGFGFIPWAASREELFLGGLDLRGKTVLDIGGYEGIYTLFFSRAVGSTGKVITFEPNPVNCAHIRDNLELNGITNVVLRPLALANRKVRADLLFPVDEPARGSLRADYQIDLAQRFESRTVAVDVDMLDNQVCDLPPPNFIKIDVEGAELEVLLGMSRVLREFQPALFIEVHTGVQPAALLSVLDAAGYQAWNIEQDIALNSGNSAAYKNGHLYCYSSGQTMPRQSAPSETPATVTNPQPEPCCAPA
jgi:FkbM family methyltransferase